ncbi:M23 family metallopeptidase [Bacteriovoracaceae bacterium]|nr:M23 family metallopeptidase [Bacteriovoracaceae bacterium]
MKKINMTISSGLLFLLITSCGHQEKPTSSEEAISLKKEKKEIEKIKRHYSYPDNIHVSPGKLTLVSFIESEKVTELTCNDKQIYFSKDGENKYSFYLSLSYFEKGFTNKTCVVKRENSEEKIQMIYKPFPYKREYLKVDKKRVFLSKKNQARAKKEQLMLNEIYQNTVNHRLFKSSFKVPLNSFITSHYGNKRVFNGKKESQHLGNDFRARVGTKIPVSNDGKVVFTGNLFYSGNTVIVYHGLDIFTVYAHLSRYKVKTGQIVKKKDIIGLSGMTGRVSGPHLHWGVKVSGNWVDGFSLVNISNQHFLELNQTGLY